MTEWSFSLISISNINNQDNDFFSIQSTMNTYQIVSNFFDEGGIFMYPLLLCSIVMVAVIIHRWLNVGSSLILPRALCGKVEQCLKGEISADELKSAAASGRSSLARVISYALSMDGGDEHERRKLVEAKAKDEFVKLQSGLPILEMIIMVAPMLGILGTASGLVIVFASFGMDDSQGAISQGIASALNTTISGLAIATPAVIANICFSRQLEQASSRMEMMVSELLTLRSRKGL